MNKLNLEFVVGLFVILGMTCVAYLTFTIGGVSAFDDGSYPLIARFDNTSGLKVGAVLEIAGVRVGKVTDIRLDPESYESLVSFAITKGVEIQEDSVASIRTAGIIGDKFVKITLGGAEEVLVSGDEFLETEPSISIEELVSKYIFDSD